MREIKFRGKRVDTGEWRVGDLVTEAGGEPYIVQASIITWCKYEVDPATVGQFTGLLDKNGWEIYEGDILQGLFQLNDDKRPKYVVGFIRGSFAISYLDKEELKDYSKDVRVLAEYLLTRDGLSEAFETWEYINSALKDEGFKVIGNIYEHSHLLNP